NLDAAPGGVNDVLAAHLGLVEVRPLETGGLPRVGRVPEPLPLATWAQLVRERLNAPFVRVLGDLQRPVARVAVCGGAGADFLAVVRAAGADVYVTADVRYHEGQQAQDLNLAVVDPGHFATEHPVVPAWVERLRRDAEAAGWSGLQVRAAEQESETWAVVAV
ncbi:MAG: Nif3-like dinuclear metal center hexameric protein, partial [Clostridia bacterium]|nr:Nif3-like dinuclear metal center hexameric protein [Clostridia bacterium]